MNQRLRQFRLGVGVRLLTIFVISMLTGCGSQETPRYQVSGTVTYQGEPIPIGTIAIEPTQKAGQNAATGFATIREGRFRTEHNRGAGAGPYLLRIKAGDGKSNSGSSPVLLDPDAPTTTEGIIFGNRLFDEYIQEVELPAEDSLLEIEIPLL